MYRSGSPAHRGLPAILLRIPGSVERGTTAARPTAVVMPRIALWIAIFVATARAAAALPSFPGAEGYGATTPGGRGGPVLIVTSLADSGPGTLRWALEEMTGPRIVAFAVGGTIALTDQIAVNGSVTVAGQTAPGQGVTLTGGRLHVVGSDVIIRGLHVRPGNGPGQHLDERDGISIGGPDAVARNVVINHNSITWGTDENLASWYKVEDITLSDNLVAEGLNRSGHSEGQHSMGLLIGRKANRVTILRNLLISNNWRNPQLSDCIDCEVINNYVFNYGPGGLSVNSGTSRVDILNNVYEAGVNTADVATREVIELQPGTTKDSFYVAGNLTPMGPDAMRGAGTKRLRPERIPDTTIHDPLPTAQVRAHLLAFAGNRAPTLDPVDTRIVQDAGHGYGAVIDAPPPDAQGWVPPTVTRPQSEDSDGDGIPDTTEATLGTDPARVDSQMIDPATGYAYIELYANALIKG